MLQACFALCGGNLHGRLREGGFTPLAVNRAVNNGVPPTPWRLGGNDNPARAVGGLGPPPVQVWSQAMVGHVTMDSSLWVDTSGCVWRRIPVIHRLTGGFAILFGWMNCGGAGALLLAFEAEYMPLAEVFPTVPGYTTSMEGAMAGVVLQLQAEDPNIFPPGMAYASVWDGHHLG